MSKGPILFTNLVLFCFFFFLTYLNSEDTPLLNAVGYKGKSVIFKE